MDTLYDITNEYIDILNSVSDEEMIPDELINSLESIDNSFNEKAKNVAMVIGELKIQCGVINNEIERLNDRLKTKVKNLKNLENYLKDRMLCIGKTKIETPMNTISVRNSIRTEIDDEFIGWALENKKEKFLNKKEFYTANKNLIKEQIETGKLNCPYARITQNQNLIIK